jgi:Nucleotidyl transferase AbiEii toxin, Type IV TA system
MLWKSELTTQWKTSCKRKNHKMLCQQQGFVIRRIPGDHTGGKWQLRYQSVLGPGGNLEIDLNFMFRVPLWPVVIRDSQTIGSYKASKIPVLDLHELVAGTLAALLARHASRDLFDAYQILTNTKLNEKRLRLAFIIYGAMNRKDWREVSLRDIKIKEDELENLLIPLLHKDIVAQLGLPSKWVKHMETACSEALGIVLPPRVPEVILDRGKIEPRLLTSDKALAKSISGHPALTWKALNVRQFKSK